MKIGYPCINRSLTCKGNSTFRLRNYSQTRMKESVSGNLDCLEEMLRFNVEHNILFFRITSDLVPFASHPVCDFDWKGYFADKFRESGRFIIEHGIRISMHPDQFTLINSPKDDVVERSIWELEFHADVLDALGLDKTAKIQIHVGGLYNDRSRSIRRFIDNYTLLPEKIKSRLVIENDDRLYPLSDCLRIHGETGIPVLFDVFHHSLLNENEPVKEAISAAMSTWKDEDGILMTDYSSQEPDSKPGKHAETIDQADFTAYIRDTAGFDFDIMLEIKDKEISALKVVALLSEEIRFI